MVVPLFSTKWSSHRLFLCAIVSAAVLCCVFVSVMDHWAKPSANGVNPKQINGLEETVSYRTELQVVKTITNDEAHWEAEYNARVELVREVCEKDEIAMMRRVWRVAANRRWGKNAYCQTRMCPIIIDEPKVLFFCFIPKVASTRVKEFFLNISNIPVNNSIAGNTTALHQVANTMLRRVSPMYYPATTARRFFKVIFVRHPFDRLVSAFRSKAEPPRVEVRYFYDVFWDKVMKKLRGNGTVDETSRITFHEFVWYLIHSLERDFDEHWAPYWNRCDPCLVDYDFIGKMETAKHDFPYAFGKVGIHSASEWWENSKPTTRSLTLKYFSQVPEKDIRDLYRIYRLDFELFGYTLDGFIKKK